MCQHSLVHDYPLLGPQPLLLLRQCVDCRWWCRVFAAEFETPLPQRKQVLRDIAGWRMLREARARAKVCAW